MPVVRSYFLQTIKAQIQKPTSCFLFDVFRKVCVRMFDTNTCVSVAVLQDVSEPLKLALYIHSKNPPMQRFPLKQCLA